MSQYLRQAREYLDPGVEISPYRTRAACWLARAEFEAVIRRILVVSGCDPGGSSMRTQLSCLEARLGESNPALVRSADYAWTALSRASHQHAYELPATLDECRHLMELVELLESA